MPLPKALETVKGPLKITAFTCGTEQVFKGHLVCEVENLVETPFCYYEKPEGRSADRSLPCLFIYLGQFRKYVLGRGCPSVYV